MSGDGHLHTQINGNRLIVDRLTMTTASQGYFYTMSQGTCKILIRPRINVDVLMNDAVITSVSDYYTVTQSAPYQADNVRVLSNQVLHFSCSTASQVLEIIRWDNGAT